MPAGGKRGDGNLAFLGQDMNLIKYFLSWIDKFIKVNKKKSSGDYHGILCGLREYGYPQMPASLRRARPRHKKRVDSSRMLREHCSDYHGKGALFYPWVRCNLCLIIMLCGLVIGHLPP